MNNEFVVSGYQSSEQAPEKALLIWRMNARTLEETSKDYVKKGLMKRQKVTSSYIEAHEKINCTGGISALKWAGPSRIFAGCYDHSVKLVNVDK